MMMGMRTISNGRATWLRSGQAVTEMAVFGSLILVGFAVLLSYAQTFTENQALQQQAFRMALRKAYDENGFVSYSIIKNPRSVSPSSNFGEGQRSSISASSSILWSKGEAVSRSFYQINEDQVPIPLSDEAPAEVWDVQTAANTAYNGSETKEEDTFKIATSRRAELQDTITTTLKLKDAPDIVITQGLGANGRYSQAAAGTTITRSRTWETPHSTTGNPSQ